MNIAANYNDDMSQKMEGGSPWWYTYGIFQAERVIMPTTHPRIQVTKDEDLDAWLAKAAPFQGNPREATLVHDLAILGAQKVVEDNQAKDDAIEALIEMSTQPDQVDWQVLDDIDNRAWGKDKK